jgi:hypothetical protein
MTPESNFDDRLDDWLEDGPTDAPGQLLDTVLAAVPSIPQRRGAWRVPWRTSPMHPIARVLAGLVIVVGLGSAAVFAISHSNQGSVGGQASPSPAAVVVPPVAVESPSGSPERSPAPTPTATAASHTAPPCGLADVVARITLWKGDAAGHRIADVELSNPTSGPCAMLAMTQPQLVDGDDSILIYGADPAASESLLIGPGGTLKTLVQVGNYCGPAPVAPVSVAFVLADRDRLVAKPLSATDVTVPPCLSTGSGGTLDMQPWAP